MIDEPIDQGRCLWYQGALPPPPNPTDWNQYLRLPPGGMWLEPWQLHRHGDGGFDWTRRCRREDGFVIRRQLLIRPNVTPANLLFAA